MNAVNNNIAGCYQNTIDLKNLRNKCFEIQTLIASACASTDGSARKVGLSSRTFFNILKKSCRKMHIETAPLVGDEPALNFIAIASIAKLASHARTGKHNLVSIGEAMLSSLNKFREAAGLPANHYAEVGLIEECYKDEIEPLGINDISAELGAPSKPEIKGEYKTLIRSALECHAKAYDALQSINADGLETFVNSVIKAAYAEAAKHFKATADYASDAYSAGPNNADVKLIDEIDSRCDSLATVCGFVTAVPEGDHDLAALDSLLFYGLDSIKKCICKLGGTEVQP